MEIAEQQSGFAHNWWVPDHSSLKDTNLAALSDNLSFADFHLPTIY